MQVVAVLLVLLLHDALLLWAGFAAANFYVGVRTGQSGVSLNQALEVFGDPVRANPLHLASSRYIVVLAGLNFEQLRILAIWPKVI